MAIIDKWLSDAQGLPQTATTGGSTNYMDFGAASHYALDGMFVVVNVETAIARTAGGLNVTVDIECDDNTSFSSATKLWTSGAVAKATLVDKYNVVKFRIPATCERYLRILYTTSEADAIGKFDAFITMDVDQA